MGTPLVCYSFVLPNPLLLLFSHLNCIIIAISGLLVFLRLQPPPPPPPSFPASPRTARSIKNRLRTVQFKRLPGVSASAICVVCLSGFAAKDEVRELGNCRHVFHKPCIDRWIDVDGLSCPLCRLPLVL